MSLAPVGLTVYRRLKHVKKAIRALQENTIADKTNLYIFSDAPLKGDIELVVKMRLFLKSITGFKSITIIERNENSRINNNRGGQQYLLNKYGKMIWLAEDIITARGFLEFMNRGLDFYENDEKVVSITGYIPPFSIPEKYKNDYVQLQRFNAWGFGIWKDKYDKLSGYINSKSCLEQLKDKVFYNKLISNGDDIPRMLMLEISGKIDALDVRFMYQQAIFDLYTIYPRNSLVENIGFDGSGVHCQKTTKFNHTTLWEQTEFVFSSHLEQDENIIKLNYQFRKLSFIQQIYTKVSIYIASIRNYFITK